MAKLVTMCAGLRNFVQVSAAARMAEYARAELLMFEASDRAGLQGECYFVTIA